MFYYILESLAVIGYVWLSSVGLATVFTQEEKRELLALARSAIDGVVGRKSVAARPEQGAVFQQHCGLFVTLRIEGQLRGCIGCIESLRPLSDTIGDIAVKAALEDPRFPSLTASEFERATLEISVLSPLQRIARPEEITIGKHGLVLELGHCRGLLLPQVAVEYMWDVEEFLSAVSKKAGLPGSAWKDPQAIIHIFTAEIIHESEALHGSNSAL